MAMIDTSIRAHFPASQEQQALIAFFATMAAGAAGFRYVWADAGLPGFALYALALGFVFLAFRALMLEPSGEPDCADVAQIAPLPPSSRAIRQRRADQPAPFALMPPPEPLPGSRRAKSKRPKTKSPEQTNQPCPDTPVFDFDGLVALRTQETMTGKWLVSDASEPALERVRSACLAAVTDAPNELRVRAQWFDAITALRHIDKTSFPKAELARAHVAETVGLGYEAVRKIATGRYGPLNDALGGIDPKAL